MKSAVAPLLALVLLLSGGWIGRASDHLRAEAGHPRPPPGPASVLGGFSAVAIQALWIRADRALLARNIGECLYYFDLIHKLEPQLLDATAYFADEIGRNLAEHEPDPDRRFALALLGCQMYDRCVAANQGEHLAYVQRGRYVLTRMGADPELRRRFEAQIGQTPFQAAQNDFADAYALDRQSIEAVDGFALSSLRRGMELLFLALERGDDEARRAAARAFRAAGDAYTELIALQTARGFTRDELEDEHQSIAGTRLFQDCAGAPAAEFPARYRALYDLFAEAGNVEGWPDPDARPPSDR